MLVEDTESKKAFFWMRVVGISLIFILGALLYFYNRTHPLSTSDKFALPQFSEYKVNLPVPNALKGTISNLTSNEPQGAFKIISYWAQWCAPCKIEIPSLVNLAHQFPELQVVFVNFDEHPEDIVKARSWIQNQVQSMNTFSVFVDDQIRSQLQNNITGLPTNDIVNDNRILFRFEGPLQWESPKVILQVRELLQAGDLPQQE